MTDANSNEKNNSYPSFDSDRDTTVMQLRNLVAEFVDERDWNQFHSPKNLSMSLAIEAAELMEHFQWINNEDSRGLNEASKKEVGEELADVLAYALALANQMNIDIASTLAAKMEKNRKKYPKSEFQGRFR